MQESGNGYFVFDDQDVALHEDVSRERADWLHNLIIFKSEIKVNVSGQPDASITDTVPAK